MAYPRFQRARDFKVATRTAGNVTVSSTSWNAVDTALDIILAAQTGDVIEYGVNGAWVGTTSTTVYGLLDSATIVSSSVVSYASSGASSPSAFGVTGWWGPPFSSTTSLDVPIPGPCLRTLTSADISSGLVQLRLMAALNGAGSRSLYAAAGTPLRVYAKNLGPQDPH